MTTYEATLKKITIPNVSSKDTVQLSIPADCYFCILAALGNQIKKKVKFWQGQTVCPKCGRLFGNSKDISSIYKHHNSHCRYCGQALDWSELNEKTEEGAEDII